MVFALLILVFLLLSNLTLLRYTFPQSNEAHKFCSDQCKFEYWELMKGKGQFESILVSFESYKIRVNKPDLILHRRFHRRWWQFWNWYDFLTHPRWKYPYADSDKET